MVVEQRSSAGVALWRRATGRRRTWSTDVTTRSPVVAARAIGHAVEEAPVRRPFAALGRLLHPATIVQIVKVANFYGYAHAEPRRRLVTGPGLRMAPNASLRNGERIRLGREVHVGERSCLWAGDSTGTITLGDNVLLGPEVFITASNYQIDGPGPVMYQAKREADVVVGADVWLGARVVVLPGVSIGGGAVVGAGAVVSKSLPSGCIAVGAPAKVVGWRYGAPPDVLAAGAGSPTDGVPSGAADADGTESGAASHDAA